MLRDGESPSLDIEVLAALLTKHQKTSKGSTTTYRDGWLLRKPPPDVPAYLEVPLPFNDLRSTAPLRLLTGSSTTACAGPGVGAAHVLQGRLCRLPLPV